MIKHRFVTWAVLGLLLNIAAYTQSNNAGQGSGTDSECNARMEAYLSQRDNCSDYYEQLNYSKLRLADAREQRRKLLQQCQDAKDRRLCEELADLLAGRIGIMEQEYETLALRGCQTTALTPAGIAKSCKAGTDANAKKAASNQNSAPPGSQKQDSVKPTKELPQSPSMIRQQTATQNNSVSNLHARPQPISSPETPRVSGGTSSGGTSDFSGASRGAVNSPSPAPAGGASSAGGGRVKD